MRAGNGNILQRPMEKLSPLELSEGVAEEEKERQEKEVHVKTKERPKRVAAQQARLKTTTAR